MELKIEGLDRVEEFIRNIDKQYQLCLRTPVPQDFNDHEFIEVGVMKFDRNGILEGIEAIFIFKKDSNFKAYSRWELIDYKIPESSSI